ncbi:hypothetical protein B0H14DRAFT_3636775 [Mycena olivaceomarginata]|nr:hypothetical protein B0H14DRAFT_3636775 [Mycena olivaceomarginata]
MSTQGHKRKRSLQDSLVDLTLMKQARKCLVALQEELDGVVETTSEITAIMTQVDALQAILGTAKKPRKFLQFDAIQLLKLLTDKRAAPDEKIQQLCTRISRIYRHISMRYEPGARMILDVLLAVAEICTDGDAKLPVAILPQMRISSGDGIYRVLNADVEDVRRLAKSQIFLIEGKHLQDKPLYDFMPEAISQAAALCEVTGTTAVRFCLTDGRKWIFSVFTKDERGRRVCYEGSGTKILEPRLDPEGRDSVWEHSIHQIVELVYHWLVDEDDPLTDVLYQLED